MRDATTSSWSVVRVWTRDGLLEHLVIPPSHGGRGRRESGSRVVAPHQSRILLRAEASQEGRTIVLATGRLNRLPDAASAQCDALCVVACSNQFLRHPESGAGGG